MFLPSLNNNGTSSLNPTKRRLPYATHQPSIPRPLYPYIYIDRKCIYYPYTPTKYNTYQYQLNSPISPMTSFDSSLFPSTVFTVSKEQFHAFHSIDRALYSRLVLVMGRDQAESVQVMALWLWLERHSEQGRNLVQKLLMFPDRFVNLVAHESVICLRCIQSDSVPVLNENAVPMLHGILGGQINLFYFVENRDRIFEGVQKITEETCLRAFDDFLAAEGGFGGRRVQSGVAPTFYGQTRGGMGFGEGSVYGGDEIRRVLGNNIVREGVGLWCEEYQEIEEVEADQRTIFLTFSKGYPTSEIEVREYFTRRFGDIVETIYMQDVLSGEQSLYARLVVRSASVISMILEGGAKAKFTINGKHVWARKYVKKHGQTN